MKKKKAVFKIKSCSKKQEKIERVIVRNKANGVVSGHTNKVVPWGDGRISGFEGNQKQKDSVVVDFSSSPGMERNKEKHSSFNVLEISEAKIEQEKFFQQMEQTPPTHMFIFANPGSGSHKARRFTRMEFESMILKSQKVWVHIVDLTQPQAVKRGYAEIKKLQVKMNPLDPPIKFIICGGDGTFMRCLLDLMKAGVDVNRNIHSCLLPFGTGNDFARVSGWGGKLPMSIINSIQRLTRQIMSCVVQHVNIWEITTYLREGGSLQAIGSNKRPKEIANVSLKKLMVNYFSVGADAQIGFEFDKRRTGSKCCNNCVYACQGLKKCCCGKNKNLKTVIDYMARQGTAEGNPQILFASNKATQAKQYWRGKPISLICTNIDSYMGGRANPWMKKKSKTALQTHQGERVPSAFQNVQKYDDGRLEFCSVTSVFGLATHQFTRVVQEQGPFTIQFVNEPNIETFLNIDGEYFRVVNPERIIIKLCSALEDGKLRALMRQK